MTVYGHAVLWYCANFVLCVLMWVRGIYRSKYSKLKHFVWKVGQQRLLVDERILWMRGKENSVAHFKCCIFVLVWIYGDVFIVQVCNIPLIFIGMLAVPYM